MRQLRYSQKNENSLDLVLFLNGIPIFTAELKNPLNGPERRGRDPPVQDRSRSARTAARLRPLSCAFRRGPGSGFCHHPSRGAEARVSCRSIRGSFGGAGNPPVPPTQKGYATGYLWEETWARDSVLDLIRQFIHEVEEEDENGRKTGKRFLIFPRYQQLDAVRKLVRRRPRRWARANAI